MNYRSIADLACTVRANLHRFPADVDVVVGIPRSGSLAAHVVALALNLPVTDLDGFLEGRALREGARGSRRRDGAASGTPLHALVVDDSVLSGAAMASARARVEAAPPDARITYCAVYAAPHSVDRVDLHLEIVAIPRVFEWNVMHRRDLAEFCVDVDGVLCVDPTEAENDDGAAYLRFLASAAPLVRPSHPIGHLVTSRLERYRPATEAWLEAHGIRFGTLHMLDLPDASTRRRLRAHAPFKADVYRRLSDTTLFIESDGAQAGEIARLSGKPVLGWTTQEMFSPRWSAYAIRRDTRSATHTALARLVRAGKRLLGR